MDEATRLLKDAGYIVSGDRNTMHGEKERSFAVIANLWNTYLAGRKAPASAITPADVAQLMVLLKIGRSIQGAPGRDHFLDAAGYSAIAWELTQAGVPRLPPPSQVPARTFWYLATPYSKFPFGPDAAHKVACVAAGLLIQAGVPAYSPIAYTHPVAKACDIDPMDLELWLKVDAPMIAAAHGIIVLAAPTWEVSSGIRHEREAFKKAGKPEIFMTPGVVPWEDLEKAQLT